MSAAYLLGMSIGPVQPFIEAARRSRDLWYGSHILSEVARAAAGAFARDTWVFPAPANNGGGSGGADFPVANRVIALAPGIDRARAVALLGKAKSAAQCAWEEIAKEALTKLEKIDNDPRDSSEIDAALWQVQVRDTLELYAACVPVAGDDDYPRARERLDELLAARKNTREFRQGGVLANGASIGFGIPKSALDGARERVLTSVSERAAKRLGIEGREALDAVGVVKRVGGLQERFTPLPLIAAHEWLSRLGDKLTPLSQAYAQVVERDLGRPVSGVAGFNYDGQLLYRGQLERAMQKARGEKGDADDAKALAELQAVLKPLWNAKEFGEPGAYVALLMADGDHMGALIAEAEPNTVGRQRDISRALAGFAAGVHTTVRKHQGQALYAGGDDVLAMLPVTRAAHCARKLAQDFAEALKQFATANTTATLSVGIAIRHVFDPLGTLRHDAAHALKLAKTGLAKGDAERNALAIVMTPRSGAPLTARGQWEESARGMAPLYARLAAFAEAFLKEALPSKCAYELRQALQQFPQDTERLMLEEESLRVLTRKREGAPALAPDNYRLLQHLIASKSHGVKALVNELLIARRVAGLES